MLLTSVLINRSDFVYATSLIISFGRNEWSEEEGTCCCMRHSRAKLWVGCTPLFSHRAPHTRKHHLIKWLNTGNCRALTTVMSATQLTSILYALVAITFSFDISLLSALADTRSEELRNMLLCRNILKQLQLKIS